MGKYFKYILFFLIFLFILFVFIIPSFNTSCNSSDYDLGYNGFSWGTSVSEVESKLEQIPYEQLGDIIIGTKQEIGDYEIETSYIFDNEYGLYSITLTFQYLYDFELLEKRLVEKLGNPQEKKMEEFWGTSPVYKDRRRIRRWYNQIIEVTLKEHYDVFDIGDAIYIESKNLKNKIEKRKSGQENSEKQKELEKERITKDSIKF